MRPAVGKASAGPADETGQGVRDRKSGADSPHRAMTLDSDRAMSRCNARSEVAMAVAVLSLLFVGGVGVVAAAQHAGSHAEMLEWMGGLMLVSGLLGLGVSLAHSGG